MDNLEILNLKSQSHTQFLEAVKLKHANKFKESIDLLSQALSTRSQAFQTSDNDKKFDEFYTEILVELGDSYLKCDDTQNALKNFNEAITILEKLYYPGHTKIANVLSHIVPIYLNSKDYTQAEPNLVRMLEIYEKTMSGEHRHVLESYYDLANLYYETKQIDNCKKIITKATKQLDTPLGPIEEFQLLNSKIALDENNLDEAYKQINLAINNFSQRDNHCKLALCYDLLAKILELQNKSKEANNAKEMAQHYHNLAINIHTPDPFSSTLLRA